MEAFIFCARERSLKSLEKSIFEAFFSREIDDLFEEFKSPASDHAVHSRVRERVRAFLVAISLFCGGEESIF